MSDNKVCATYIDLRCVLHGLPLQPVLLPLRSMELLETLLMIHTEPPQLHAPTALRLLQTLTTLPQLLI